MKKNFRRHERTQKHLNNLQNYVPENILDREIIEQNLQQPIQPIKYKPKKEKKNKRKKKFEELKREIINEFDDLENNFVDISPNEIKKQLKRVFTEIKTNKRNFDTTDFETDDYKVFKSEEALEKCFLTLRVEPKNIIDNIEILIEELPGLLYNTFKELLKQKQGIKVQIYLLGLFYHIEKDEEDDIGMSSKNQEIMNKYQIRDAIKSCLNYIKDKIDAWDNNEAYWHLKSVLFIDFKLREYKPINGSSYIPTPKDISTKKCVINIKNEDQECFKYCLLYGIYKEDYKEKSTRNVSLQKTRKGIS